MAETIAKDFKKFLKSPVLFFLSSKASRWWKGIPERYSCGHA